MALIAAWSWRSNNTNDDEDHDNDEDYDVSIHLDGQLLVRASDYQLAASWNDSAVSIALQAPLISSSICADYHVTNDSEDGATLRILALDSENTVHAWRIASSNGDDIQHTQLELNNIKASVSSGIYNGPTLVGLAVAGQDGTMMHVEYDGEAHSFIAQQVMRVPSTGIGLRNFWSGRNGVSSQEASAVLSLEATYSSYDAQGRTLPGYLFSVSRDRRLRVWSSSNNAAVESINLPSAPLTMEIVPASTSTDASTSTSSSSLLAASPRPLLRYIPASKTLESPCLLVHIPTSQAQTSFFILYTLSSDDNGQLVSIAATQEIPCDFAISAASGNDASLVDFQVVPNTAGRYELWTLWNDNGQGVMRVKGLQLGSAADSEPLAVTLRARSPSSEPGDLSVDVYVAGSSHTSWRTVHSSQSQNAPPLFVPSSAFDNLFSSLSSQSLDAPSENLSLEDQKYQLRHRVRTAASESFLVHIFFPNRYALLNIRKGLADYLSSSSSSRAPQIPESSEDASIAQTILDIIGSSISIPTDAQTGALQIQPFLKAYKTEWLKFVTLVEEGRREGVTPIALASLGSRRGVLAISRGGQAVPAAREGLQQLYAALQDSGEITDIALPRLDSERQAQAVPTLQIAYGFTHSLFSTDQDALVSFEQAAKEAVTAPLVNALEDVAADVYEAALEHLVDDETVESLTLRLRQLAEGQDLVQLVTDALRALSASHDTHGSEEDEMVQDDAQEDEHLSDMLHDMFLSFGIDLASASLQVRYSFSLSLFALILFIQGELLHPDPNISLSSPSTEPLITEDGILTLLSLSFDSLKQFSIAKWLAEHNVALTDLDTSPPSDLMKLEDGQGLLDRMADLKMGGGGNNQQLLAFTGGQSHSVLASLLAGEYYSSTLDKATADLSDATFGLLNKLGVTGDSSGEDVHSISCSQIALIAEALRTQGLLSDARMLVEMMPEKEEDAGLLHLEGMISAEKGDMEEAFATFKQVAGAIYTNDSTVDTLRTILDPESCDSRSAYYRHMIKVFDAQQADRQVADACRLAIQAHTDDSKDEDHNMDASSSSLLSTWLQEVWYKAFRALVNISSYDEAYSTMLSIPFKSIQQDCLRHLIVTMCESSNDDGQSTIEMLIGGKYNFVGLHDQVEQILSFRAKNSHPLAWPDYHKILYAWYVSRSDFRAAASTMYLRAKRLTQVQHEHNSRATGGAEQAATAAAQSYLAAMNSLSLVDPEKQFILIELSKQQQHDHAKMVEKRKQRIMDAPIPDPAAVALDMIKKDYVLALARLELAQSFPELQRPNQHIDAIGAVALFSQIGMFDSALQVALSLNVDMSPIFTKLAIRCVHLTKRQSSSSSSYYNIDSNISEDGWILRDPSASNWEGTLASKGWSLLHVYLIRYDEASGLGEYRKCVLMAILNEDRRTRLPRWLSDWFMAHHPEYLIWHLIEYDMLEDAFGFATQMVNASSSCLVKRTSQTPQSALTYLPYNLLDQLMVVDLDEETQSRRALILELQKELRELVKQQNKRVREVARAMRMQ